MTESISVDPSHSALPLTQHIAHDPYKNMNSKNNTTGPLNEEQEDTDRYK